jgi:phosphoribosylpyrophosphate synthetase
LKVIFEKDSLLRQGDIIAISNLLERLEEYPIEKIRDNRHLAIINLWIKYLDNIANKVIASNLHQEKMPTSFEFPFEKGFLKEYEAVKESKKK